MTKKIRIEKKSHFGTDRFYIVSEHAADVNFLTGKKTVDKNDVRALERLGFTCVINGTNEVPAAQQMNF